MTNSSGTIYSASYDADGNMTTRNGYQILWTPANLPSSIASANGSSTFSYDPDGQRYYQSAQSTLTGGTITTDTTYVGGLFEVISTSGTAEYRHNIVADGQIVAVHTIDDNGSASTSYLHYDHLGSVDAITGDNGSVIQTMSFDAFGQRRDPSNWNYDLSQNTLATLKNYTDRGYTDEEELDNVSLVDLNGRVYDPTVGRFISADPTIPDPLYSQAFNRYSYTYNSPLEATDPSGFTSKLCEVDPSAQGCVGGAGSTGGGGIGDLGGDGGETPIGSVPCYYPINCPTTPPSISDIVPPEFGFYPGSSLSNFLQFQPSAPPQNGPSVMLGKIKVNGKQPKKSSKPSQPASSCVMTIMGELCFGTSLSNSLAANVQQQQNSKACSAPGDNNARNFVNSSANQSDASVIAGQLNTPIGNILGFAGFESAWGTSNVTAITNNYFGLTATASGGDFSTLASGTYYDPSNNYTYESYPDPGLFDSGESFALSPYGMRVAGTTSAASFVSALNAGAHYNNENPLYNQRLINTINTATNILGCH